MCVKDRYFRVVLSGFSLAIPRMSYISWGVIFDAMSLVSTALRITSSFMAYIACHLPFSQ